LSGQKLNKNGTSPRANSQVNKMNRGQAGRYIAEIVDKNIPGRKAGLKTEQANVNKAAPEGNTLNKHHKPEPQTAACK